MIGANRVVMAKSGKRWQRFNPPVIGGEDDASKLQA